MINQEPESLINQTCGRSLKPYPHFLCVMNKKQRTTMPNDETRLSETPSHLAEQLLAQRKAFETAVTLRAWNDAAFAEQLAQDPLAAINAAFGIELPAELDVQLHHESPTTLHLVLPPMPLLAAADEELSVNDLERVAGGSFSVASSAFVTASISIGSVGVIASATVIAVDRLK